jgi:hypothetical protein
MTFRKLSLNVCQMIERPVGESPLFFQFIVCF